MEKKYFLFLWLTLDLSHVLSSDSEFFCGLGIQGCTDSKDKPMFLSDADFDPGSFVKPSVNQYMHYTFGGVHDGVREAIFLESRIDLLPTMINLLETCRSARASQKKRGEHATVEEERKRYFEMCGEAQVKVLSSIPWLTETSLTFTPDLYSYFKHFYVISISTFSPW